MKKVICDECEQETDDYTIDFFGFITCNKCGEYWDSLDRSVNVNG